MIGRRERRASLTSSSAAARVKASTRRTANDRTRLPSIDNDARAFTTLISNGSGLEYSCKIMMLAYECNQYMTASAWRSLPPPPRGYGLLRRYRRRWIDFEPRCEKCLLLRIWSVQLRTKSGP